MTHQLLSVADMEVLAFERATQHLTLGRKDAAALARFNDMPARYYQRLNTIIDKPAALAYDPELVHRLTRIRTQRHQVRTDRNHIMAEVVTR